MVNEESLKSLFEKQVRANPKNRAAIFGAQSLSYETLNQRANQLAHYLLEQNIKVDTPVAVCMERSLDLLVVIMGILKAGGVYLPIDANQPEERLLFILNDCATPVVITTSKLKKAIGAYPKKIVLLDKIEKKLSKYSKDNPSFKLNPRQLAYIIYTSGSTGTPKGVLIEHATVVNYSLLLLEAKMKCSQRRIDFSSNHIFDMAITNTMIALCLGLEIVICDDETKKDPSKYLHYLKEFQINLIKLTPSYFKLLLQTVKTNFITLPKLESILLGGENLSTQDCKDWLALYPKQNLYNEYGPTEATVGITNYKISIKTVESLDINVPIGKPGPNIYCYVLDKDGNQLIDEIGELYIGGDCLARGYINRDDLTKKQFIKDPFSQDKNARLYKTGDLCKIREDGLIEYFGRIDNQVKIRGYRIEPGEVEKYINQYPAIEAAVVIDQKDSFNENCLVAYYTLKDAIKAPTANQLRQFLQAHVPEYMIPTAFVRIEAIPLTPNGKLDRAQLTLPLLTATTAYRKPRTQIQKMLAEIWSEELGVLSIGLDDDFFELGGHSLSAARIISKINNLGKDLSLYDFYKGPNIGKLAKTLKKAKLKKRKRLPTNRKKYQNLKDIPLSDFQFLIWMSNTFASKVKKLNIVSRKRFEGTLNSQALEFAFDALINNQEVLRYKVLKFRPFQQAQKKYTFKLVQIKLDTLADPEMALENSINELINYQSWNNNSPLIRAKVFYLKDSTEIQLCLPHSISDDMSPEIVFLELSKFYLLFNHRIKMPKPNQFFRDYVYNEQHDFGSHLMQNLQFWEDYLQDTTLFAFPAEKVIPNMQSHHYSYSTYVEIPQSSLEGLKKYCSSSHVSLNDGLTAVLMVALFKVCDSYKNKRASIFINIVKSTRDNPIYDETIGCFLRLEPVKIDLDTNADLKTIALQIHQSTIETVPYQDCSNLIKLTATKTLRQKVSPFKTKLVSLFTSIYALLCRFPKTYKKIFKYCGSRLISLKRDNHFLITLNVHNNFHEEKQESLSNLFNHKQLFLKPQKQDLLKIENVFEVSFLRDEEQNPFMVISANLQPDFREIIGKEVIKILSALIHSERTHPTKLEVKEKV